MSTESTNARQVAGQATRADVIYDRQGRVVSTRRQRAEQEQAIAAMSYPSKCRQCGGLFDLTGVEVTARYADCDMFKAPCCGAQCDTRGRWGGPSWARMGYDDIRAYRREEREPYPMNGGMW